MKEKYLLVSLDDEKSKKIATIISNDTCRKILDYLSEHDGSETDISKALGLPLSTVHYNVQNLHVHGLVLVKDFEWSEKGNKINIYCIAKRMIVIAPKGQNVANTLKSLVPPAMISIGAAALVYAFSRVNRGIIPLSKSAAEGARLMKQAASQAAMAPSDTLTNSALQQASLHDPFYSAAWFLAGALFALAAYMAIQSIRSEKT